MATKLTGARVPAPIGLAAAVASAALAVDVNFKAVAPCIYAYTGDLEGGTYENEAPSAGMLLATAVRTFDRESLLGLKYADIWVPQLANHTYLEMERGRPAPTKLSTRHIRKHHESQSARNGLRQLQAHHRPD